MLNTEAHAFPRFDASKKRFKTGWARIPRDAKGDLVLKADTNGAAPASTQSASKESASAAV